MDTSQVYITIPLYNDSKMILKVIKSLNDKGYNNIVVVDDGSTDNGYELVKKNNILLNPVFIKVSLQSLPLESKAQTYSPRRINYKMFLIT